jgi:ATP-dependent DNA helicase RecQ
VSLGAYYDDEHSFEGQSIHELVQLWMKTSPKYIGGHNFIQHDKTYLEQSTFNALMHRSRIIDTLYLSMLLFPDKVTHKLDKPYKQEAHIANSPFGDCVATKELLSLLVERFFSLDVALRQALYQLLRSHDIYAPFFDYIGYAGQEIVIYDHFCSLIQCDKDQFRSIEANYPVELALVLSYLATKRRYSPSYILLQTFPDFSTVLKILTYRFENVDLLSFAKEEFDIPGFRDFDARENGESLFNDVKRISQKEIIEATLQDQSILAILPTGGGKTFTFQMPALIKARAYKSLTVVISPLQALMKNHVESFREKNQNFKIAAISGYLSPIERINVLAEVENGVLDILYLAPEALRSNSIFSVY